MIALTPADPRIACHGLAGWRRDGDRWEPWRLPHGGLPIHPDLAVRARMPAGARIVVRCDAPWLELDVDVAPATPPDWRVAATEVIVDGRVAVRRHVTGPATIRAALGDAEPGAVREVVIWLPHFGLPRLGAIRVPDGTGFGPPEARRPRVVVHGSSISQCKEEPNPSRIWPVRLAAAEGWDLTCLGFGGQCHLDPVVARYVRDLPAAGIHLCLGINVYGAATHTARSLPPAVTGFLATIRDGHPTTPITVCTPIVSPSREDARNAAGLTLAEVRAAVAAATTEFRAATRDANLFLIDGLSLLGPDDAGLLHDGLHPCADGYRVLGERLRPLLAARFGNAHNLRPGDGT
jgi:hypothetical protein